MSIAQSDLKFLRAGVDQITKYLLSNDVYWPIGIKAPRGAAPYPQLTLGWLLLARQRAQVTSLAGAERQEFERLDHEIDTLRTRWLTAWGNKARHEFRARLNLWRDFLDDYRQNPAANQDRYPYEVNRRVLLIFLQENARDLPDSDSLLLTSLDKILFANFQSGDFIWDPALIPGFPESIFWFLYGRPGLKLDNS